MTVTATGASRAAHAFKQRFGRMPDLVASAPGRVNLIGEHTDYNGGDVLPIAISDRTYVAAMRSTLGKTRARSLGAGAEAIIDARTPEKTGDWWDYLSGVMWAFARRGIELPQLDFVIASGVPMGAGLSSSAALEVASAAAINALIGESFSALQLAEIAHEAEREFVGVACGVMDQFTSALAREGYALLIHCDTREIEHVPFGDRVLILDSGVRRDLRSSAFNERQRECTMALNWMRATGEQVPSLALAQPDIFRRVPFGEPLGSRVRHVIEEQGRVAEAVAALRATEHLPGALLNASHESLRTLYECSTPELDWLVTAAQEQPGVTGARLTGAGWGGCVIAVGDDEDALRKAADVIAPWYTRQFELECEAWTTKAGGGIQVERV